LVRGLDAQRDAKQRERYLELPGEHREYRRQQDEVHVVDVL